MLLAIQIFAENLASCAPLELPVLATATSCGRITFVFNLQVTAFYDHCVARRVTLRKCNA